MNSGTSAVQKSGKLESRIIVSHLGCVGQCSVRVGSDVNHSFYLLANCGGGVLWCIAKGDCKVMSHQLF